MLIFEISPLDAILSGRALDVGICYRTVIKIVYRLKSMLLITITFNQLVCKCKYMIYNNVIINK